ncbi:hypothetical protein KGY79_09035 [Candidatus Bipolaricaulota bacterium]|nr:hypothetical protein [Candidatus Bipolaricaulota bacterium]
MVPVTVILVVSIVLSASSTVRQKIRETWMFVLLNTFPSRFKKVNFRKLSNEKNKIYLLGTTHRHFGSDGYSLRDISAVIKNLRPDILLVESRPEQLQQGNLGDGPPEMLFAHLFARSRDIPVKGMDWWNMEMSPGTTTEKRDDKMVENVLRAVSGKEKVLILTGFTHVIRFIPRLVDAGYERVGFGKNRKEELFEKGSGRLVFPEKVEYYLRKRIQHDKDLLQDIEDPEWEKALTNVIESFESVLATVEEGRKEEGKNG